MSTASHIPFPGHSRLSAPLTGRRFLTRDQVLRRLVAWFDLAIPEGYEDETGFHFATVHPTAERDARRRLPGE